MTEEIKTKQKSIAGTGGPIYEFPPISWLVDGQSLRIIRVYKYSMHQ